MLPGIVYILKGCLLRQDHIREGRFSAPRSMLLPISSWNLKRNLEACPLLSSRPVSLCGAVTKSWGGHSVLLSCKKVTQQFKKSPCYDLFSSQVVGVVSLDSIWVKQTAQDFSKLFFVIIDAIGEKILSPIIIKITATKWIYIVNKIITVSRSWYK